jgi:putative transposase
MNQLIFDREIRNRIQRDNGSKFISRVLDKSAYEHGVTIYISRHSKPMDNAIIESFNRLFRDECLNKNWFLSIKDTREKIEIWRKDYKKFRSYNSLGDLIPRQFAEQLESQKAIFLT